MVGNAWVGRVKDTLYPPAEVLIARLDRVAVALSADAPDKVRTDVAWMRRRAVHFRALVTDTSHLDPAAMTDEDARKLRHNLRAEPSAVVMGCDLWARRAEKGLAPAPPPGLADARAAAQELIDLIGTLRADAAMLSVPPPRERTSAVAPGRVLIVDDKPENRAVYREALAEYHHRLTEAETGAEALDLLAREPFDVVLLDLFMPGMSGYEVLVQIRQDPALRHVPVVMISALDEARMAAAAIEAGAEDYLPQPFSPQVLQARVTACLERKRLRDREVEYQQQIDRLFHALFPADVVDQLRANGTVPPRLHDRVGVMFLDVVGFTRFCEEHKHRPETVVALLQDMVTRLEAVARAHGVQKIKTIGDAFLATAGLSHPDPNPADTLVRCAAAMIRTLAEHPGGWRVRVGVHVGPVLAGVIGDTQFQYDLWGNTVNLTARLQAFARPGGIILSPDAFEMLTAPGPATRRDVDIRGVGPVTVWELV